MQASSTLIAGRDKARALEGAPLVDLFLAQATATSPANALRGLLDRLEVLPEPVWRSCAEELMRRGRAKAASEILRKALKKNSLDIEARYLLGASERLAGNGTAATEILEDTLHLNPGHERATIALALIHRDRGRMGAAASLLRSLQQRNPSVDLAVYIADFLGECRRTRDAYEVCESALAAGAESIELALLAGANALSLGLYDVSRRHLLEVLQSTTPEWGAALPLALCQRYNSIEHPDFMRFEAMLVDENLSEGARSAVGFALGKALDDIGDWLRAAEVLRIANRRTKSALSWKAGDWAAFVENQLGMDLNPLPRPAREDLVPIFIVGLPRTGTTLAAELLSRHEQVRSRGELNWISFIAQYLQSAPIAMRPERLRTSAELYLAQLRQDDAPVQWYIDKNPLNFRHLNLIAALFPNARIIHCRRSRRDTALSIWSQKLDEKENGYAYSFDDIAAFAQGHDRLFDRAHRAGSMPIHSIDYETLVTDPQRAMREAFSFLGIEDFDAMDAPARMEQAIGTASVWQARQPIYQRSAGRWRAYAPYLPELEKLFGD